LRKVIAKSPGDDYDAAEEWERVLREQIQSFTTQTLLDETVVVNSTVSARKAASATSVRLDLTHRAIKSAECIAEEERYEPAALPSGALSTSLTEISFAGNDLTWLPDELSRCTRLRRLCAGANSLTSIPDLSALPLEHAGFAGNRFTDSGLGPLLANLPTCLRSLDLSLNRLELLQGEGGALAALSAALPSLRHLSLTGNPLAISRSYPDAIHDFTQLASQLTLIDGAEVQPKKEVARAASAAEAEPGAADAGESAPGPGGVNPGKDPWEQHERVTLRFTLRELTGLPMLGSGLQQAGGADGAGSSGELLVVKLSLLGEERIGTALGWSAPVVIGQALSVTLPCTVALRDALAVRGVAFEWALLPVPEPELGAEAAAGGAVGEGAEEEAPPPPPVPPGGLSLCTMRPTWRPLTGGDRHTQSQQVSALVQLPAPPRKSGEKRPKKPKPFELTLSLSCEVLPAGAAGVGGGGGELVNEE